MAGYDETAMAVDEPKTMAERVAMLEKRIAAMEERMEQLGAASGQYARELGLASPSSIH
jgi:O-acetylhomoserine/O-acetylserine sulfhydrylase-like pyridoxal-dependent enzyme